MEVGEVTPCSTYAIGVKLTLLSILISSFVLTSDEFWSASVYSDVQDILENVRAVLILNPKPLNN